MSYKDLDIKLCYETSGKKCELVDSFYVPMLSQTVKYLRIAGFFSSTSLAIASRGIAGLINNGGVMKLLISPEISNEDYTVFKQFSGNELSENSVIFKDFSINDFSYNEHLQALAWMLANNRLEIKIVVNNNLNNSIFHQKVGIGFDADGNMISFSGSINETAQAWLNNIEEFKTFKSWEPGQLDYLLSDLKKFNAFWKGERSDVATVYDLPRSLKDKIISVKPRDIYDLAIMKDYVVKKKQETNDLSLFEHQKEAVQAWIRNDHSLLFEMATGTGKTRTAIGCFIELLKAKQSLFVIVATPQNTLSRQWKKEVDSLGVAFERFSICDGSNPKWRCDLEIALLDMASGELSNCIIYTTHDTASSSSFIKLITAHKRNFKILFVCDEVHAIGSDHQKEALLNEYDYRIGLSATPERMFDEEGTKFIRDYFGNKSFEFSIHDALNTINPITNKPFLNQFYYYPVLVHLNDEEQEKYNEFSRKIACILNSKNEVPDMDKVNMLRTRRAEILKNAEEKLSSVSDIIDDLNKEERIQNTIIFGTDKQVEPLLKMLSDKLITRSKITENESASKKMGINNLTEREEIIEQFRRGTMQVLVGIKCLDEGIDIKNARIAILMASSTNPREYVQRVGRVIRPDKNKKYSIIYDLIVAPDEDGPMTILQKEARRALMIASNAINAKEVETMFNEMGVEQNANK